MGDKAIDIVDIKEYVGIVLKRKWLVMACFIVCLGTMTVILMLQQPTYTASARINIASGVDRPSEASWRFQLQERSKNSVGNAVETLKSDEMIMRVLDRASRKPSAAAPNTMTALMEYRNRFIRRLDVVNKANTTYINLNVESIDAKFAADFANLWATEYIYYKQEQLKRYVEEQTQKLRDAISIHDTQIAEAQRRLDAYISDKGLSPIDEVNQQDAKRLGELRSELDRITNERIKMETVQLTVEQDPQLLFRMTVGRDGAPAQPGLKEGEKAPAGVDGTRPAEQDKGIYMPTGLMYFDLQKARAVVQMKIEAAKSIYKDRHPIMTMLKEDLARLDLQVAMEVQNELLTFRSKLSVLRAQERGLKEAVVVAESKAAEAGRKLREYNLLLATLNDLKDQRLLQQKQYDSMVFEVSTTTEKYEIMEKAVKPEYPTGPKFKTGLSLAAIFGLALGIVLAFFIEYVDDSIKVAEEVERDLKLPFLGMVPAAHWTSTDLKSHLLHNLSQQSGIAEAYRMVRSAVLFAAPKDKLRVILMTSAVPLEGKTTTSLNLSIGFAQANEKVLLIDADMRRGELHRYFDLQKEPGLSEVLKGERQPDEVVQHTEVENLDMVSTGVLPTNPAELLLHSKMKEFLDWARTKYDRVFIDAPPAMGISDAAILSSVADGLIMVVWAGHTSRRFVRAAKDSLLARGANLIGFMLNNLDIGRVGYYYYYPYYYSYYYTYQSYGKDGKPQVPGPRADKEPEDVY